MSPGSAIHVQIVPCFLLDSRWKFLFFDYVLNRCINRSMRPTLYAHIRTIYLCKCFFSPWSNVHFVTMLPSDTKIEWNVLIVTVVGLFYFSVSDIHNNNSPSCSLFPYYHAKPLKNAPFYSKKKASSKKKKSNFRDKQRCLRYDILPYILILWVKVYDIFCKEKSIWISKFVIQGKFMAFFSTCNSVKTVGQAQGITFVNCINT